MNNQSIKRGVIDASDDASDAVQHAIYLAVDRAVCSVTHITAYGAIFTVSAAAYHDALNIVKELAE